MIINYGKGLIDYRKIKRYQVSVGKDDRSGRIKCAQDVKRSLKTYKSQQIGVRLNSSKSLTRLEMKIIDRLHA